MLNSKGPKPSRLKRMNEDELYALPREDSVREYFRVTNFKAFTVLLCIMSLLTLAALIVKLTGRNFASPIGLYLSMLFFWTMWWPWKKVRERNHFYYLLMVFLVGTFIISMVSYSLIIEGSETRLVIFMNLSFLILFFRFNNREYVFLFALACAAGLYDISIPAKPLDISVTFSFLFTVGFIILITYLSTRFKRKKFLKIRERELNRHKDRLRMKQELTRAREIQLAMLPPELMQTEDLEFACRCIPATEVGGDYYDYFSLDRRKVVLVVGDVSDHGLASGLVLNGVRCSLYLLNETNSTPAGILGQLNRMVKKTTDKRMFMTLIYSVFNMEKKLLWFSNAGHPSIFHYHASDGNVDILRYPALPVGGILNASYKDIEIPFQEGDVFLLYSDGLIEASGVEEELYGTKRLENVFRNTAGSGSASQIRDGILEDVESFSGRTTQDDDLTLVVVKIKTAHA